MRPRLWLAALAILAVAGCSKNTTAPPPSPPTGTVSVSPPATVVLVHGSRDLTATIHNSSATAVTWRLVRQIGLADSVAIGTIVSTGPLTATYTAPARVITPGFDYAVTVLAVAADTTLRGSATIVVPRVSISLSPGYVASVPPGTLIPYRVKVDNAPNKGFALSVEGISGGDASVGTWLATTETTAVYAAPVHDSLHIYSLFANALEDDGRFATATVTVRAGFPLPGSNASLNHLAPAWSPVDDRLAFVRGGPPWELVVHDFASGSDQVLTTINWAGGRIAWSKDATRLLFSERLGPVHTIGLINANGTGRTTFAPDPTMQYEEACFFPYFAPASESLYVVQADAGGAHSLRAHGISDGSGDPGRVLFQLPANGGDHIRSLDAWLPISGRPQVAFSHGDDAGFLSAVLRVIDAGAVPATNTVVFGNGMRTSVRWIDTSDGFTWITFVDGLTHNLYRVQRTGSALQRLYVDYFPEAGGDLRATPTTIPFVDAHAVSRVEPSGKAQIWIIGAPLSSVVPVSRALEIELRRAGAWTAIQPREWRLRRLTP